jgi:glucose/arabinose dehydrogenase
MKNTFTDRYFLIYIFIILFLLAACNPGTETSGTTVFETATAIPPSVSPSPISIQTATLAAGTTLPTNETASQPKAPPSLPLPPADEASDRLKVPEGFAIRIFAQGLSGSPRFIDLGPDGSLYLSLIDAGMVVRLADADQNGLADSTEVVASGLNYPHGLAWQGDWLYVAENDHVERLRSTKGSGGFDVRELVTDNIPSGTGHYTRTVHFGPDGKMYVSAGSSCNVCQESDPRRAAILRFNPDGSIPSDNPFASDPDPRRRPLWAWGLRNSVDFLWTPGGEMWASMNGRDNLLDANGLPDNLPPEVIVFSIQTGSSYGWPYCYTPILGFNENAKSQVLDNQSGLKLPTGFDCSQAVPAVFTDLAHSAPLGMSFVKEGNFPAVYQPDLYVAYHGSWNVKDVTNIRDCKVERVVVENGQPVRSETFVSGWRAPGQTCASPSAYGRPADVVFGPDGAMYISDDTGGRVYRLIYTP